LTKQKFVLDENVVIFAEKLTNAKGEFDALSLKVLTDILVNCHSIAVDEFLQAKYDEILQRMASEDKSVSGPAVTRIMAQIRNNSSKYLIVPTPHVLETEETIPKEDRPLVRLVAAVHGMLVTRDEALSKRITASDFTNKYEFQVRTPEEALSFLSP